MIKKHWKTLLITNIIILLPLVWMCINYNSIPEQVPIHFNIKGEIDAYGPKASVLLLPIVMFIVQWAIAIEAHFREKKQVFKAPYLQIMSWTCAAVSVVVSICIWNAIFGNMFTAQRALILCAGITFIITGNLMPKLQKNRLAGLRIKWTLEDSDIWFKTHRLAGKFAIIGGLAILPLALIKSAAIAYPIMAAILLAIILVPVGYSYVLYKKKVSSNGTH